MELLPEDYYLLSVIQIKAHTESHVLLGIIQAWNKRLCSPQTLCKYQMLNQWLPTEGCEETKG